MTKLSDTQRILLSSAAQRESGSLLPLPTTLKASGGTTKAVAALLKHGLVEERETADAAAVLRVEAGIRYGVFITPAGAAAIGVELDAQVDPNTESAGAVTAAPAPSASQGSKPASKAATVIALLARPEGATLPDLIEATGWLPHTTRAALTGIRKKGHEISRGKRDGATCYRIVGEA